MVFFFQFQPDNRKTLDNHHSRTLTPLSIYPIIWLYRDQFHIKSNEKNTIHIGHEISERTIIFFSNIFLWKETLPFCRISKADHYVAGSFYQSIYKFCQNGNIHVGHSEQKGEIEDFHHIIWYTLISKLT